MEYFFQVSKIMLLDRPKWHCKGVRDGMLGFKITTLQDLLYTCDFMKTHMSQNKCQEEMRGKDTGGWFWITF